MSPSKYDNLLPSDTTLYYQRNCNILRNFNNIFNRLKIDPTLENFFFVSRHYSFLFPIEYKKRGFFFSGISFDEFSPRNFFSAVVQMMAFNIHLVLFISTESKGVQNLGAKRTFYTFHGIEASWKPRIIVSSWKPYSPTNETARNRLIFCRDLVRGGKFARKLSLPDLRAEYSAVI